MSPIAAQRVADPGKWTRTVAHGADQAWHTPMLSVSRLQFQGLDIDHSAVPHWILTSIRPTLPWLQLVIFRPYQGLLHYQIVDRTKGGSR